MSELLKVGTKFDLNLKDETGKLHKIQDYKGKKLIVYFYPSDDTPGCTIEACNFRDNYSDFKKKGIIILGVSKDEKDSHNKFIKKHNLPFPLLVPTQEFLEKTGAWQEKSMYGKKYMGIARITYVIDENGKILNVYPKVKVEEHVAELLELLK